MFDNLRSDYRDKARRASRREANRRHVQYEGKSSARSTFKWGGKVRVSTDPDYDYSNEVGGFKSIQHYYRGHGSDCKGHRGFRYQFFRRWLKAQVGRPWNDVWSEICSRFDSRSSVGRELRTRFHDKRWNYCNDVQVRVYIDVESNVRETRDYSLVDGLYVHPWTGILSYQAQERVWGAAYRHRRDKTFVSSEIGYYIGEEPFFIGHWRNNNRKWHYKYFLEEVGVDSKRPDKNRIDMWFLMWTEIVGTEKVWTTVPGYEVRLRGEAYYLAMGYEKRKVKVYGGYEDSWGKWETRDVTRERRRSCTHDEIAWINDLIRERQDGVTNQELKKNREGVVRRSHPWREISKPWVALAAKLNAHDERKKGGVPVS